MKGQFLIATIGLAILASLSCNDARAESTTDQLTEQATGNYQLDVEGDSRLKEAQGAQLNRILSQFAYLDEHFQLMDEFGVEEKLKASMDALRKNPRAAEDLMRLYKLLTEASADDNDYLGEARWRALYVLGELRDKRVTDMLFDVATQDMPSGTRVSEQQYEVEYRLRARAIAGLEMLRQTELLRRIYEQKGLFSGLAAASLYELGEPPRGIVRVDGRKILGLGDPKDYNPRRGETPLSLPPGQVERKTHDDDEPAVSPNRLKK
jgi:hypothetical protein